MARWRLVTEQRVSDPLLSCPVLEAFGLNTRDLLAAAADRFCGVVNDEKLVDYVIEERDGRIYRVMGCVSHADGEETKEHTEESDGEWCDIGNDTSAGCQMVLKSKLLEI